MLQYLNQGYRTFGENPIPPHTRLNWEFYAVVEGKCAPVLPGQPERALQSRQMWVFSPEVTHGWRGEANKRCRVFCYHFAVVPPPLDAVVRNSLFHVCSLDNADVQQLESLGEVLKRHFEHPTNFTHIHFQKSLIELSLLALKNIRETSMPELSQAMNFKVEQAIAWFIEHLVDAPSIEQVAAHISVSPSFLRKMFMLCRQENPLTVFKRARLQRAMELLSESNAKLETIASHCGYVSSSVFCRAFKNEVGVSPSDWRRNDYAAVANAQAKPVWRGEGSLDLKKPFY